ncbi:hypothetical protein [Jiella marina]|uniref:hypothetical protein n=1 Tax=Jiella sp. LLJ827 TaxID=2917712 RepID=UPI002101481A|nr:hypothetical protein [Jiella sp. LLJ827]MCQ0988717.1 hypothetical protein [Jiella sp. LLJ827]
MPDTMFERHAMQAAGETDTIIGAAGIDRWSIRPDDTLTDSVNLCTSFCKSGFGQGVIAEFEELDDCKKIDLSAVTHVTDRTDLPVDHP